MSLRRTLQSIIGLYPIKKLKIKKGKIEEAEPLFRKDEKLKKISDVILSFIEKYSDVIREAYVEFYAYKYEARIKTGGYKLLPEELYKELSGDYEVNIVWDSDYNMLSILVSLLRYEDNIKLLERFVQLGEPCRIAYKYGIIISSPIVIDYEKITETVKLIKEMLRYEDKITIWTKDTKIEVPSDESVETIVKIVKAMRREVITIGDITVVLGGDETFRPLPRELVELVLDLAKKYRLLKFDLLSEDMFGGYRLEICASNEVISEIMNMVSPLIAKVEYDVITCRERNIRCINAIVGKDERQREEIKKRIEEYERMVEESRKRMIEEMEAEEYEPCEYDYDYDCDC